MLKLHLSEGEILMDFFSRLTESCRTKGSLLCVGLDPRIDTAGGSTCIDLILEKNRNIIAETAPFTACYKPNIAFYEKYGADGITALKKTLELIPDDIPVLLDAKRNDIGATAEAYADGIFGNLGVDAVTLNPYMGKTSVEPFLKYRDKGLFMLCRTSNPGAGKIQELAVSDGAGPATDLFIRIAREVVSWGDQAGLVVAGNDPVSLEKIRDLFPDVWILAPGIGAQGGTVDDAVSAGIRGDGFGILPVVVRSIADDPEPGRKAEEFRDAINRAREKAVPAERRDLRRQEKNQVLKGLISTGCFKVGEFLLKSGKKSPFYIDIRRVSSDPSLLRSVGRAYADIIKNLDFDRIAGIPVAALPIAAAVSLETGIPMIYPRIEKKKHGTGNVIEGEYKKGERVLLLDDLITTGKSKLEALEILRAAGLVVEDLAVLIERGARGRKDMEEAGISLHSYADVSELLLRCRELGIISLEDQTMMSAYAGE